MWCRMPTLVLHHTGQRFIILPHVVHIMAAREPWYEIHAEYDGHVTGYGDRETAESRAAELSEEFEQEHWVKEVDL